MKTPRSLRILVIMFALGMLGAYVVYSQRQRVTPNSKAVMSDSLKQGVGARSTNRQGENEAPALAPGSKAFAPVISVESKTVPANHTAEKTKSVIWSTKSAPVFPGSKSDVVFDFKNPPKTETNSPRQQPPSKVNQTKSKL